jgi:hypothetical protein
LRQFNHDGALCCGGCHLLALEFGKTLPKPLPLVFELLFGCGGKFESHSQVVVGTSGGSFRRLTLPDVFGNQMLSSGNLRLRGGQGIAQTFKLNMQFAFCLTRVRRRDECSGFEMSVPTERLVKPDGEFTCHLQLMQRLTSIASVLMCGLITSLAQAVKELRDLRINDLTILELVKQVALGSAFFDSNAGVGSGMLGQEFTKLAEFDQGRIRIIEDVTFGKGSMADKYLIVLHEEGEIR